MENSQTEALPYWLSDGVVNNGKAEVRDFHVKTERSSLILVVYYMAFKRLAKSC